MGVALGVALGMGLALPHSAHAQSTSLLTNGNFETGTFAGWTVINERPPVTQNGQTVSAGNFFIDAPGTTTPAVDGFTFNTAANTQPGGGGNSYAVTSADVPGRSGIIQSFTTPTITAGQGLRLTLTFDWFVNDQSTLSTVKDSNNNLSYNTYDDPADPNTLRPNQYARVDVLRFSSADASFSTDASDVLQYIDIDSEVPTNSDPNTTPNPYQRKTVQLTGLQGGTQYKIRFAEVDNQGALNFGVDNIGIQADITPEPATLALMLPLAGMLPLFLLRARRRKQNNRREVIQN